MKYLLTLLLVIIISCDNPVQVENESEKDTIFVIDTVEIIPNRYRKLKYVVFSDSGKFEMFYIGGDNNFIHEVPHDKIVIRDYFIMDSANVEEYIELTVSKVEYYEQYFEAKIYIDDELMWSGESDSSLTIGGTL